MSGLDTMQAENNRRFDEMNRRFDRVDQRFAPVFEMLCVFKERITRLEEKAGVDPGTAE